MNELAPPSPSMRGLKWLNKLRVAHLVIFDWPDRVLGNEPGDVRLRC
jgi:hypothetical protein